MQSNPVTGIECSLYELLEVPESADAKQLTAAFRRLAKEWHPDVNQDRLEQATERMKKISAAYQTLKDPTHRAAYDLTLQAANDRWMHAADHSTTPPGMPDDSPRQAWWTPPAGSPVATIVNDPSPPRTFPTRRSRHDSLGMGCFTHRKPAVGALERHITRAAWLVGSAILCLASGAFLLFLAGAHRAGQRGLARWGALYALTPIFLGIDQASPSTMARTVGGLLLLSGTAHVFWWRRRLYAGTTGRPWDAG
jgi:hypothetical protein